MEYILNISIYLSFLKVIKTLHPMISMWSVFYTYTDRKPSYMHICISSLTKSVNISNSSKIMNPKNNGYKFIDKESFQ